MNMTHPNNPTTRRKHDDVEQLTRGTLDGSFEELYAAGCIQTQCELHNNAEQALLACGSVFYSLMALTQRNPCNGCPIASRRIPNKSGPLSIACSAFQAYHSGPRSVRASSQSEIEQATLANGKNGDKWGNVPIRAIAKQLNISLSEARRRKLDGTL